MNEEKVLISADDLAVGYGAKPVFSHFNLSICEGDYLFLVGENGAGKTTLFRTLLGLQNPLAGTVALKNGLSRTDIGYLPQENRMQKDFPASVYEIVLSGRLSRCGRRPFYRASDKKAVEYWLTRFHIETLKSRAYRELSGGQMRRVLLARTLCGAAKMLFLDEPTAGLDENAETDFYGILKELHDEGITIVMISHNLSAAKKYGNRMIEIGDAKNDDD